MTTLRIRFLVSLATVLATTTLVSGCAGGPSTRASGTSSPSDALPFTIRFDNDARDYVHVYLVGESRQWLLGRVEPGARVTLQIPLDAIGADVGSLQLAAVPGGHATLRAAREPSVTMTILQPAAHILAQRWTYSQAVATGRLTSLPSGFAREGISRR